MQNNQVISEKVLLKTIREYLGQLFFQLKSGLHMGLQLTFRLSSAHPARYLMLPCWKYKIYIFESYWQ